MWCSSYTSAARRSQVGGSYFQWEGFEEGVCVYVSVYKRERKRDKKQGQRHKVKLHGGWVELCQIEMEWAGMGNED